MERELGCVFLETIGRMGKKLDAKKHYRILYLLLIFSIQSNFNSKACSSWKAFGSFFGTMKKAFDQTVRDIKRGVNKKVLKVPSIEQKVLDATSNEPWGPHGSLLADIALASRNYHEYQMIMSVIWKRINDTGKNWRHVYKGLTVLEYLVANGSERVINEIREHAYQITTLSEFQYIDSNAKDQGSNVRKKSQSLVSLVNDKEKIQEVRQKAAANWDKFHNTSGGVKSRPRSYPGPGGFDDDRYGGRDEDRNGYGREREWGDDKYGSRDGEERYGRDHSRDDEYRGRRSVDGDNYGRRSRSSDRERERAYEDEGQYSSRGSYAKTDDQSQDGRPLERRSSEQNLGIPPSYEDAVGGGRSPIYSERDGEVKSSPPPVTTRHETTVSSPEAPAAAVAPPPVAATPSPPAATSNKERNGFDEFDPRGSFPAAPPTSGGAEMDLFGSPSDSFSVNALALVPTTTATSEADAFANSNPPGQTFVAASSASISSSQPFEDPFGDGPFRAVSSTDGFSAPPQATSVFGQSAEPPQSASESGNNFGYGGSYDKNTDILADLLPPAGPSQTSFQTQPSQLPSQTGFPVQPNQTQFPLNFQGQPGGQPTPHQDGFQPHGGQTMGLGGFQAQMGSVSQSGFPGSNGQPGHGSNFYGGFEPQGSSASVPPMAQVTTTPAAPQSNTSSLYQQPQPTGLTASTGALAIVPQQPSKFETKSTVWADTLNRGLVNLNIAGSKTNPLSDIGVDFEALNRKEKRMEKASTTPMTSNVTMGKAMGSGSGFGRAGAGAGALRPQPNPMMGSSMVGPGGYGAGYGGVKQPMGQFQMQPQSTGFPPGSAMSGTYNPMMGGGGGYGQQPYGGGGYR